MARVSALKLPLQRFVRLGRRLLERWGGGLGLSRDTASCCKSLGQQRRAVWPVQDGRAPGIFNGISVGRGRDRRGWRSQGDGAGRALLGRGCRLWQC